MKSILLVKKLLGLVEITSGLVNASFSLPEWRAVKMIFFAMNCQEVVLLVLLDLSDTFDSVKHSVLLSRLSTSFGIREKNCRIIDFFILLAVILGK